MTYTLMIHDNTSHAWFNFLRSFSNDARHDEVISELKEWGGRIDYDTHGYSDIVIFDRIEDAAWFLLKWS